MKGGGGAEGECERKRALGVLLLRGFFFADSKKRPTRLFPTVFFILQDQAKNTEESG